MKIYEIATGYTSIPAKIPAATEIVVEQLTIAMKNSKCDVEILDIIDPNRALNILPITEIKIPSFFLGTDVQLGIIHKVKRVLYSVALAFKLKQLLNNTDEKVLLHFHNQYNMFFFLTLVGKKQKNKCITAYTNHSGIWRLEWSEIKKTIKRRYFQEIKCMKNADYVFALNNETICNACFHLEIPKEKFVLINNGVNTTVYKPIENRIIEDFKEKNGYKDKKIILQVGSVYENKGQFRSIKNMECFLKSHPEFLFVFVGDIISEKYKNEIDTYVKEHKLDNCVKYHGIVKPGKELNELYNAAECTIISSKFEGFSLVVLESMAAGVPVLVNQKSDFFLGKGNILYTDIDFTNVLKQEVLNPSKLKQHRIDARENVMENYDWSKIAKDYNISWRNFS